nr:MAG TPA: hypothetical protein [Caudoviricetes sp.]
MYALPASKRQFRFMVTNAATQSAKSLFYSPCQ